MATELQRAQQFSQRPLYVCPHCGKLRASNHAQQCPKNPNRKVYGQEPKTQT